MKFNGTVVELSEQELSKRPRSCYLLYIKKGRYLDCEQQAKDGKCLASKSNCVRGLVHTQNPRTEAQPNCVLQPYPVGSDNLWLKLTKPMRPNDEVLWNYGLSFNIE